MSTERRIRSRRTHHKSRLGCENCKRRRVKCDEIKPTCTNCQNHSVECDYSTTSSPPVISPPGQAYRFRQSKYQVASPFSSASSTSSSPNQPHPSPPLNPITTPNIHTHADCISFADLQLFHHYLTSTAATLTENHDPKHLWITHVPQWSFTSPYLLHLILALSALHLAHQQPSLSAAYRTQADAHFAVGVRGVTAILTSLDAQNCQPLYMAAVLVCFVYFGHGPREGEFLVFGVGGRAEWLVLMHGVRSILESRRGQIFTEALEPEVEDEEANMGEELEGEVRRHGEMIREVKRLIGSEVADAEARKLYDSMLDQLGESFGEVFRMRSTGRHGVSLMHLIIGWIYRLPKEFVALLEGKDPFALVILAYWSILLKSMQSSWMMNGWDEHVLSGIEESLQEDRRGWIQWPVECIRGVSGSSSIYQHQ